jgi:FkbM family methyltransferase
MPIAMGVPMMRALNLLMRITGKQFLAETAFGATLYCSPRDLIQVMILHFGVWEPEISNIISRILQPGDVFVDIGANIGYDSILASSLVGPSGRVVAVEAAPDTFTKLLDNLARNACGNSRAVNVAASEAPSRISIYAGSSTNSGSATTLPGSGSGLIAEVDALPVDQILTAEERSRVKLIKIDVEGAECSVMRGIIGALSTYPSDMQIIVEMASSQAEAVTIFDAMLAAGFTAYAIQNAYSYAWYLKWRGPNPPLLLSSLPNEQTDVLFTRDAAKAAHRLSGDPTTVTHRAA